MSDCESVDQQVKLMYSPFLSYPPLSIPSVSSRPSLLEVGPIGPLIASWESGDGISSPSGLGGAQPPNAFWCIVGIN